MCGTHIFRIKRCGALQPAAAAGREAAAGAGDGAGAAAELEALDEAIERKPGRHEEMTERSSVVELNSELEASDEVIQRKPGRHEEASKRSSEVEASEEATERQPGCHQSDAMGSANWIPFRFSNLGHVLLRHLLVLRRHQGGD